MNNEIEYIRKVFLDSSAIVAWVYDSQKGEPFGAVVANFCRKSCNQAITNELCISEAFNVFKRNLKQERINESEYGLLNYKLCKMIEQKSFKITEFQRWDKEILEKTLEYTKKYKLDFVDCLQIVEILNGTFSSLIGPSKTILVMQDSGLSNAAKKEGSLVWLFNKEDSPL